MMTESRFSESDGGGCILLPFCIEPNQEDTVASHLTTGVTFLMKGQGNAPWTGYYVLWRGALVSVRMYQGVWFEIRYDPVAKIWLAYHVAQPAFNLLHKPSDRMNLDELRAQTLLSPKILQILDRRVAPATPSPDSVRTSEKARRAQTKATKKKTRRKATKRNLTRAYSTPKEGVKTLTHTKTKKTARCVTCLKLCTAIALKAYSPKPLKATTRTPNDSFLPSTATAS
ncbi:hypothetical protein EDB89DRAFT_2136349 [Lactarius sanguifluus]|nr:hypothetical protein EDB89DRAFT_2136349 [Lactarius sanguifluus]